MNKKDIENRLIEFSVNVIEYAIDQGKHPAIVHLKDQAIRSSTATALNYAEAQSAESRKDFIHKLGLVMKELRETQASLKLIKRFSVSPEVSIIDDILCEMMSCWRFFTKLL